MGCVLILDDQPRLSGATRPRVAPIRSHRRPPRRRSGTRHCIVYGFNIFDPHTRQVLVDYVGQTVQPLSARELQHRGTDPTVTEPTEQPWSDLIVGDPFVIEEGEWTLARLDEREVFHIHRLRPRYNYEHNLGNPNRIPIWQAQEQRAARDAAKGVVSASAEPARPQRWAPRPGVSVPAGWERRWNRLVGWSSAWLALMVVVSAGLLWRTQVGTGSALELGAVSASVLLGVARVVSLSKRRRARLFRWSLAVGAAVLVAAVVWAVAR